MPASEPGPSRSNARVPNGGPSGTPRFEPSPGNYGSQVNNNSGAMHSHFYNSDAFNQRQSARPRVQEERGKAREQSITTSSSSASQLEDASTFTGNLMPIYPPWPAASPDDSSSSQARSLHTIRSSTSEDDMGPLEVELDDSAPQWDSSGWLDQTLRLRSYWLTEWGSASQPKSRPYLYDHRWDMTIHVKSVPFAHGEYRTSHYARTDVSTNRFVVKSHARGGQSLSSQLLKIHGQCYCKEFALEFNALVDWKHSLDFVTTTLLEILRPQTGSWDEHIILEPFVEDELEYVQYNDDRGYVSTDRGLINSAAQAFSHFTFERSKGRAMVTNIQGRGRLLTDPVVSWLGKPDFQLDNMSKAFFDTHICNFLCRKLELQSRKYGLVSPVDFKKCNEPPKMTTSYCANRLCNVIIRMGDAHETVTPIRRHVVSDTKEVDYHYWCNICCPQLKASMVPQKCRKGFQEHMYDVSRFYHESRQISPGDCHFHIEKELEWGRLYCERKEAEAEASRGKVWNEFKSFILWRENV